MLKNPTEEFLLFPLNEIFRLMITLSLPTSINFDVRNDWNTELKFSEEGIFMKPWWISLVLWSQKDKFNILLEPLSCILPMCNHYKMI